jgi:hypothetical protein
MLNARQQVADKVAESEEQETALAKLAEVIGCRDGLADLRNIFNELDIDGSGALDIDEFTKALKRFGIAKADCTLDENFITAIFNAVDRDGNGVVDFDEFAKVAKCELELVLVKSAPVAATESLNLEKAVKSGVRMRRSASKEYDLKMQGEYAQMS